jgi:hypothetical protein
MIFIKRLLPVISPVFLLFLIFSLPASASRVSIEMGDGTMGVSAGGDFRFGYVLGGFSARFIDDFPWSYIPTRQSLTEPCENYKSADYYPVDPNDSSKGELAVDCDDTKGGFHDGEEWEIFGKLGWRVPRIPGLFLDLGAGISYQRTADLYIFCNGITVAPGLPESDWRSCNRSSDFTTWGRIHDRYSPTVLWGIGIEPRKDFLLNIDYHSRRGPLLGMTWRF